MVVDLEFNTVKTNCLTVKRITKEQLQQMDYSDLLQHEVSFTILLNKQVYFHDDYFCILELVSNLIKWQTTQPISDFSHEALDTEDNPLISFHSSPLGWILYSPWGNFDASSLYVSDLELISAVNSLIQDYVDC